MQGHGWKQGPGKDMVVSWLEAESWQGHGWYHGWKQNHGKVINGKVMVGSMVGSRLMEGS